MTKKLLFWGIGGVILLVAFGLSRSDYHIPIGPSFALMGNGTGDYSVDLTYRYTRIVGSVLEYSEFNGGVIGRTASGYFAVTPTGQVTHYFSHSDWRAALGSPDYIKLGLKSPTRLRDPIWSSVAGVLAVIAVMWVLLALWRVISLTRRSSDGN